MLLAIYLGTTAYVWIDSIKTWKEMDKRLIKDGYKFTNKRKFFSGDILFLILGGIALSLPVFNLLFPIVNHDKDASYDNYKNYLEEAGAIELNEQSNNTKYNGQQIGYISNMDNILKLEKIVNKDKPKQVISYIPNLDNMIELKRMVNEQESKNIIDANNSKIQERINRNGHTYYSSIQSNDSKTTDYNSHVYKKTLK